MAKSNTEVSTNVVLPGGLSLPALSVDPRDGGFGEVFGGNHPTLDLKEGESSQYLQFMRQSEATFPGDDGVPHIEKVFLFRDPIAGKTFAGPVSAIFSRNMTEANVSEGDIIRISRWADAKKKAGRGANKPMRVFSVTVYVRHEKKPLVQTEMEVV